MKLRVELGERGYDIVIKRGALGKAGMLANLGGQVLVVTDSGVPNSYVKTVLAQCGEGSVLALPAGERHKTAAAFTAVLERLQAERFGREGLIAAVGGGTVSDIAAFAAACYRRGTQVCLFPTTTTAQLDAAVGGRCGINVGDGQSNVGVIYQPGLVLVDPDTLYTLPPRVYAAGMAEALKTGLADSRELFEALEGTEVDEAKVTVERLIYLCLRAKKGMVERDEYGRGERGLLAFGTTLGLPLLTHSQKSKGDEALLHGEAIALGMLPMIESRTLLRRTLAVMKKWGLPCAYMCDAGSLMNGVEAGCGNTKGGYRVVKVKTPGCGAAEIIDKEEMWLLAEAFALENARICAGHAGKGG